ncbi:hypothetical protein CAEBREN_25707 [Caenorhabditis brenneri]|uniref:Membrane-associated tyrosine- and threonine-specific cdc2-inhibitory kinase wee-1.3 n=1 Tax=Caenorhabditis brenneri TaxID=135651 RepID=G0MN76_CAEBE|nr:hypothetical protein CAEBREN_25707 [Caenorhabditis brenneri]
MISPMTVTASSSTANTTPRFPAEDPDTPLSTKTERRRREAERRRIGGDDTPQMPRIEKISVRRSLFATVERTPPQEVLRNGTQPLRSPLFIPHQKRTYLQQCFLLERVIAKGKFGEVFACRCRQTDQDFAVKVSLALIRGASKHREAQSHMSIPPHPHLLKIVSAWEQHERLFIQTERCWTSLQDYCSDPERVSDERIWGFTVDLLRAVRHLHGHGMIHDDIKPDNIFLTWDLRCKLGDFGLAVDLTNPVHVKNSDEGDSRYMAPELLAVKPSKASDMFSLGVSIFESRKDVELPETGGTWHRIRRGEIPKEFFKDVCVELIKVFMALMSHDPKDRPTAQELLESPVVKEKVRKRDEQIRKMSLVSFDEAHPVPLPMYSQVPPPVAPPAPSETHSERVYARSAIGDSIDQYLVEVEKQEKRKRAMEQTEEEPREQKEPLKVAGPNFDDSSDDEVEVKLIKKQPLSDSAQKKVVSKPSDEERCIRYKRISAQDESSPRIRGRQKMPRIIAAPNFNMLDEQSDTED